MALSQSDLLVSSMGRCWGGSVLGGGQEDDLGYARGGVPVKRIAKHLGRQNSSLRRFIANAGGLSPMHPTRLTPSPDRSTQDLDRPSAGRHHHKRSPTPLRWTRRTQAIWGHPTARPRGPHSATCERVVISRSLARPPGCGRHGEALATRPRGRVNQEVDTQDEDIQGNQDLNPCEALDGDAERDGYDPPEHRTTAGGCRAVPRWSSS